jgi:hypothetical protein
MSGNAFAPRLVIGAAVCVIVGIVITALVLRDERGETTGRAHASPAAAKGQPEWARARAVPGSDVPRSASASSDADAAVSRQAPETVSEYLAQLESGGEFEPRQLARIFENQIIDAGLEKTGDATQSKTRLRLIAHMARELTALDPAWAADLVEHLPEFHDRFYFAEISVRSSARQSPEAAIEWIEHLAETGTDERALSAQLFLSVAQLWGRSDLERARSWAEAQADHPMATEFVRGLATVWAQQAPDELLEWLEESGQPEETKAAGLAKLATLTSAVDPKRAVEIAVSLPPSAERTSALRFSVSTWARTDTVQAIEWVDALQDEILRSAGRLAVVSSLGQIDADAAHQWIDTWQNDERTVALARTILIESTNTDPDAGL